MKFVQNVKKNRFWSWWDKMHGTDYKTQVELVDELYDETFDSEGDNMVC